MGSHSGSVARQVNGALSTLGETKLDPEHTMEVVFNLAATCRDGTRGILTALYHHAMACEAQARDEAAGMTTRGEHEDARCQVAMADAWSRIADPINEAIEHDWDDWFLTGEIEGS